MLIDDWPRQLHPKLTVVDNYSHTGKNTHRYACAEPSRPYSVIT